MENPTALFELKAVVPLLVPLLAVLALISLVPQLTLWLPTLWYR